MKHTMIKRYMMILAGIAGAFFVCGLIVVLLFQPAQVRAHLGSLISILRPFINGIVIAYLLNFVCRYVEKGMLAVNEKRKRKMSQGGIRAISITLSFVVFFIVLALLLFAVLPSLVESISNIVKMLPNLLKQFQNWIEQQKVSGMRQDILKLIDGAAKTIGNKLQTFLSADLLPNLQSILTNITSSFIGIASVVVNFGIGCIVAVYLLTGKERFILQVRMIIYAILNKKWADWFLAEMRYANRMFSGFIVGKIVDSFIIGVICFIFCLIAGIPDAILVSVLVGVTNIIPFFGPYIGLIPAALIILMQSPVKCLIFVVFDIVLQQIDGNVIGPKILGNKTGLSGIWVLFSIMFFSALWGIVGMLVGVPLFAVIYHLISNAIFKLLRFRNRGDLIQDYNEQFPTK